MIFDSNIVNIVFIWFGISSKESIQPAFIYSSLF
jgi:hypothetical protein